MNIIVWVRIEELAALEAGEKVDARMHVEQGLGWIQVMVESKEYALEYTGALFGAPYALQKKA